jgi:dihydrofolate reductase
MAKLIYAALTSLDGCIADEAGNFDWAVPDEEVHAFINDLERPIGTYLYGRKMYETMAGWETPDTIPDRTPAMLDFARIWKAADKIVYSRTLHVVSTAKTRLERKFDPEAVRKLKGEATGDVAVGGPALAGHAIRAGLVDEYHLFVAPIILGGGNPYLPGRVRVNLELLDERGFDNGMVHVRYRAKSR